LTSSTMRMGGWPGVLRKLIAYENTKAAHGIGEHKAQGPCVVKAFA
jgi:hypothetical protein